MHFSMVIGFSFAKQQVRLTVLDGTKAAPVFLSKDKLEYGAGLTASEIAVWLDRNLSEAINRVAPQLVCYRLAWSYNKQQQAYSLVYPCAILEVVCSTTNIPCKGFGYQALTSKALGFPKGVSVTEHCTALIGAHPPYWDAPQINSSLAAIAGMD